MKRFMRRLIISFEQDDLFFRVVFVQSGLLSGGIGIALLVFVSTDASASPLAEVLLWTLARTYGCALRSAGAIATGSIPGQERARCRWIGGRHFLDWCNLSAGCVAHARSPFARCSGPAQAAACMTTAIESHGHRRGSPTVPFRGGVRKVETWRLR